MVTCFNSVQYCLAIFFPRSHQVDWIGVLASKPRRPFLRRILAWTVRVVDWPPY